MKTVVEQRAGTVPGTPAEAAARLLAAFPRARQLPAGDRLRLAVPVGLTGLQQIVIDFACGPPGDGGAPATLCGYGKEGLLSRKPTRTVTDQAWSALICSAGR